MKRCPYDKTEMLEYVYPDLSFRTDTVHKFKTRYCCPKCGHTESKP